MFADVLDIFIVGGEVTILLITALEAELTII